MIDIRTATEGVSPAEEFLDIRSDARLQCFKTVTVDEVRKMIGAPSNKYSMLDPMPTWLLKSCSDLLVPCVAGFFNTFLSSGVLPANYKEAFVSPG